MTTPTSEQIERTGRGTASSRDNEGAIAWDEVATALRETPGTSWLSVTRHSGGVHTRPLFAAWGHGAFHFVSKAGAAKTAWLRADAQVSIAVDLGRLHLVAEGVADRLADLADLERASAVMLEVFDWPTEVVGDQLDAPYAAPTSGGPPFEAWRMTPRRAYAFPTADQFEPTRFVFS